MGRRSEGSGGEGGQMNSRWGSRSEGRRGWGRGGCSSGSSAVGGEAQFTRGSPAGFRTLKICGHLSSLKLSVSESCILPQVNRHDQRNLVTETSCVSDWGPSLVGMTFVPGPPPSQDEGECLWSNLDRTILEETSLFCLGAPLSC